jgi:hypothetical protein
MTPTPQARHPEYLAGARHSPVPPNRLPFLALVSCLPAFLNLSPVSPYSGAAACLKGTTNVILFLIINRLPLEKNGARVFGHAGGCHDTDGGLTFSAGRNSEPLLWR